MADMLMLLVFYGALVWVLSILTGVLDILSTDSYPSEMDRQVIQAMTYTPLLGGIFMWAGAGFVGWGPILFGAGFTWGILMLALLIFPFCWFVLGNRGLGRIGGWLMNDKKAFDFSL